MRELNFFQNKPKLEKIDAFAYLERLESKREEPSLKYLKKLHKNHLLTIAYENLDIHYGQTWVWDIQHIFKKIVLKGRGGINLELNFVFFHLLTQLGFDCFVTSANLAKGSNTFGPNHEHMVIVVSIGKELWLADVGLQESAMEPRLIEKHKLQVDYNRYIRFEKDIDDFWYLKKSSDTSNFNALYRFKLEEFQLIEFLQVYNSFSIDSTSLPRDKKIISKQTAEGRVTLTDRELTYYRGGQLMEESIKNEDQFFAKLDEYFDLSMTDLLKQ